MVAGAVSGVLLLGPADVGPFRPVAAWPAGRGLSPLISAAAEAAVVRRRPVVQGAEEAGPAVAGTRGSGLAWPVLADGRLQGVVAVEVAGLGEAELRAAMRQLQWGAAWVELLLARRASQADTGRQARVATALDLIGSAIEESRFAGAALGVATELALRLEAERVSLGYLDGDRIEVVALSHTATFNRRMELVRQIAAAMDEALDQRASIVYPAPVDAQLVTRAHASLAKQSGAGAIVTVPMYVGDSWFGGLSVELAAGREADAALVDLLETVGALVGPVLLEKRLNDRPVAYKLAEALGEQGRRLLGAEYYGRKLAAVILVALVAVFSVAAKEYRVAADAVLEGGVQRAISVPVDGYVLSAAVRAGDLIATGQEMARLDDRELLLERQRWAAELSQRALEYDQAQARGQRAEAQIVRAQMAQAEAQTQLLDEQLARMTLLAPFDGIVISGDLSQSIGKAVRRGEPLFELAPLDSYRVVLKVDETDIDELAVGQSGHLVIASMPDRRFALVVDNVTPVSVSEEGRNYFRVEASLTEPTERLRPGMSGVGKVEVGERKLIWIWTHGLIDWARLKLWAWWR
jgi:RND family efflux transporter MFP subunit